MSQRWVSSTARASLLIQVISGIANVVLVALSNNIGSDLQIILALDTIAQFIEFVYYVVAVCYMKDGIRTWTRYFDWFFSTPMMLITMGMFFRYRDEHDVETALSHPYMVLSLLSNALMLLFGFGAEIGQLSRTNGLFGGSIAYIATFTFLSILIPPNDYLCIGLFTFTTVVWGLYGVAFIFSFTVRNVAYNLLDIFSKNVFGLFLAAYIIFGI